MDIKLDLLRRADLYPAVKKALASSSESYRDALCPAGQAIASAVQAGWFLLPNGRNNTYSHSQFFKVLGLFRSAPWVSAFQELAASASADLLAKVGQRRYEELWSHPQGLPSFDSLSRALPSRIARMPHQWGSGAITASLVVDCLQDNHSLSQALTTQVSGMLSSDLFEASTALGDQIDSMVSLGMQYQVPQMLMSTRRLFLDRDANRFLMDSLMAGKPGATFEEYLSKRKADDEARSMASWKAVFTSVQHLAAVVDGLGSTEHIGTMNHRLRINAGPQYRVISEGTSEQPKLTVTLGGHYLAGRHVQITTLWELKNWVMRLADILEHAHPSYEAYIAAEKSAKVSIDLSGQMALPQASKWRPHDDFDTGHRTHQSP